MHRSNAVKKPAKRTRPPTRLLRRFSSLEVNYETEKRKSLALYQLQDFENSSVAVPNIFKDQADIRKKLQASVEKYNFSDLCVKLTCELLPQLKCWGCPDSEALATHLKRVFKVNDEEYARLLNIARTTYVPKTVIHAYVVEAQNIPSKDSNGLADPFCVIYVGGKRDLAQKTKVVSATLNPTWKEQFTLDLNDPIKDVLHVDVMDHNEHDELLQNRVRKIKDVKSPGGLGVLLKDFANARLDEEPIGSCRVSVLEVFPKPIEKWFDLEQDDKHRGKIYLRIALGTGKPLETFFQDYVQILHLLVLSELDKYGSNSIPIYWDENFDKWSNSVLGQLKLQGGLISKHVVLAKWMVYSIVNSIIPLDSKMMYLLMDAVLGKISTGDYDDLESSQVWTYTIVFIDSIIKFFAEVNTISLNSVAMEQTHRMLKSIELFNEILDNIPKCDRARVPFKKSIIRNRVKEALRSSAYNHYLKVFNKATDEHIGNIDYPMYQTIEILLKTGQILQQDLADGLSTVHKYFKNILDVDYFAVTYQVYDEQFGKMVKCIIEQYNNNLSNSDSMFLCDLNDDLNEDSPVVKSAASVFLLYFAVRHLANLAPAKYIASSEFSLKGHYHDWFYQSVDVWITALRSKIMKFVKNSIEVSQPKSPGYLTRAFEISERNDPNVVRYGASAIDTVQWFHEINKFWISLSWQNPRQSYCIVRKLLDELYGYAVYYATEIVEVVQSNEPPSELQCEDVTIYAYLKKICTEIENISYVKVQVDVLAQQLNISNIFERISLCAISSMNFDIDEVNQSLESTIGDMHKQVETSTKDIISHCIKIVTPKLHKLLGEVLKQEQTSLNTCPQFQILIDYIDKCLAIMNTNLEAENFRLVLIKFWDEAVNQVNQFYDIGLQSVKTSEYFQRLSDLITVLNSLFWPSDIETMDISESCVNAKLFDAYQLLKERLLYLYLPLAGLKLRYYERRYKRQQTISTKANEHGNITVRVWFLENENELVVDLMNARKLKSYDTNNLSDPFAVVTLVPSETFPSMPKYTTKVHYKTLFPLFDETFSFKIGAAELKSGYLLISLFDNNYFVDKQMGEVFFPLTSTTKVQKNSDLKSLPQIFLEVNKPDERDVKYLEQFEQRSWDKKALQFCNQERSKRNN